MNSTIKILSRAAFAIVATLSAVHAANVWQGDTDSDFNTGANYVGDTWAQWNDYVLDSNAVNPAMNVDEFVGWGNISLNSGLTTNIVIEGSQPIVMAPAKVADGWVETSLGGTIDIASDSKNLTVNTGFLLSGTLNMNVGTGRTLTANGAVNFWDGQGHPASLDKQGSGTAVLAGANNYNGTTTIGAGTLVAASSTALGAGGWDSATMTTISNAATLALLGGVSLAEHIHLAGAGVDSLGVLRSLSGNNALTMTYNNSGSGAGFSLGGTATIGVDADTFTVTGFYHDSGSYGITKVGNGTLVLTQTNTYTGATTVNAGTLRLGTPLLTDNFTVTGISDTHDLNYNLANRQTGSLATKAWTGAGEVQVGNATDVQQPTGTGGDYLLLAFGGNAKLGGMPLSSANVTGPLKITFDMFKGSGADDTDWTSFTLSADGNGFPVVGGSGEFGFLYRKNTGIQIFNNGALMEDFSSTTGGDSFGFYLADTAGTGSAFSGNGTRVIVTQGGSVLGSYSLNTGMAASLIAFGTAGWPTFSKIGGVDNLVVSPQRTNILDPSTYLNLTTAGSALELDNVLQTVAGLEGVAGTSVALGPFSCLTVNGTADSTFSGDISGTLADFTKSGAGMLTLSGTNTYTGTTTLSNGTLRLDGDSSGATGALTVETGARLGGNGSYGGNITLNDGAALNCDLTLADSTLTCDGQLSFTSLNFANCTFTVAPGAGYRVYTLIEAASLGTVTFANAEGTIAGVSSKLYMSGNKLMLIVGQGTLISFF